MKNFINRFFIEGLKGMACGLFVTWILGMALQQTGLLFHGSLGSFLQNSGSLAMSLTGAGIGIGIASRLQENTFSCLCAAIAGMAGAFSEQILDGSFSTASHSFIEMGSGDPLGAFIAAFVAIELARLMTGRFNMDIILAPLAGILGGCLCGFWIGIPVHSLMEQISRLISWGMQQHPLVMGITVAVFMGMVCAMPLSAPALAMILQLNGTAAGAATIGCCCSMIGLALAGYRDNGIAGFLAVGLGTSKLQFPKIIQRPVIWLPSILSSAILGPIGVLFARMTNSTAGAGLGTTIFMGPVMSWQTMAPSGDFAVILVKILVMYFILPGVLTLSIANAMRKLNIIKPGDMSLNL